MVIARWQVTLTVDGPDHRVAMAVLLVRWQSTSEADLSARTAGGDNDDYPQVILR